MVRRVNRRRQGITTSTVLFFIVFDTFFLIMVGLLAVGVFAEYMPTADIPFSSENVNMNILTGDMPECCGALGLDYIVSFLGAIAAKIGAFFSLAAQLFATPFIMMSLMPFVIQLLFAMVFFVQIIIVATWLIGVIWSGAR